MTQLLQTDSVGCQLQSEYRLKVLTLCLDRSYTDPHVVFEVTAPDAESSGAQKALLTTPSAAIGLPARFEGEQLPDRAFTLPEDIRAALTSALAGIEPAGAPLWVKFTAPVGLLPVVPWERLLQPAIGTPVLRLPYHRLSPAARRRNLDCVVCFSSPSTTDRTATDALIDSVLRHVPADLVAHTVMHLFGDLDVQPHLHDLKTRFGSRYDIRVYEPPEKTRKVRGTRSLPGATRLENPWLLWMRDALGRRCVDVMHFLGHSFPNSCEEGALALAKSPAKSDDRWEAGYVGAAELAEFLNQVGAWSIGFTSPPGNASLVGLRLLQDEIARLRPGPCLLHDMADPGSDDALGQSYRFLFNPDWQSPAGSGAVSLYCHPWHALSAGALDSTSDKILHDVTLVGRVADEQFAIEENAWLVSAQRVLEQSATTLACEPTAEDQASNEGRRTALEFIANSFAKYASEAPAGDAGGHKDPEDSGDDHTG